MESTEGSQPRICHAEPGVNHKGQNVVIGRELWPSDYRPSWNRIGTHSEETFAPLLNL